MRRFAALASLLTALFLLCNAGCKKTERAVSPAEVVARFTSPLPATADDAAWANVPVHTEALLLQDLVEPRLMATSTPSIEAQAATDGQKIVFRLAWSDPTQDDVNAASRFGDGCAVQFPAQGGADLPAPQMGEPGRPVEITYWSATWQAYANGRPDTIAAIYPRASIDHYPFEAGALTPGSPDKDAMARRYAPAREVGNPAAGPWVKAVDDLVAEGPGTLHPAPESSSSGTGTHTGQGWSVIITRPLPKGVPPGRPGQVAFAVWQGANQEAGSRKMRTGWIPLKIEARP